MQCCYGTNFFIKQIEQVDYLLAEDLLINPHFDYLQGSISFQELLDLYSLHLRSLKHASDSNLYFLDKLIPYDNSLNYSLEESYETKIKNQILLEKDSLDNSSKNLSKLVIELNKSVFCSLISENNENDDSESIDLLVEDVLN